MIPSPSRRLRSRIDIINYQLKELEHELETYEADASLMKQVRVMNLSAQTLKRMVRHFISQKARGVNHAPI